MNIKVLDEFICRIQSMIDFILRVENTFLVFDENHNLYRRGRKYQVKVGTTVKSDAGFSSGDGWVLTDIKNGTRFYYKR